jgi:Htaa
MRKIAIAAALAATALVVAPSAIADPVTGGKTVFKPDVDTFEGFADMSISVGATGAAEDTAKGVVFPISQGQITEGPKGNIRHRGGLVFSQNIAGGETLKFSKFQISISQSGKVKLFAKVADAWIRFLDLDTNAVSTNAAGTRLTIHGAKATLAKTGAEVMSSAFDFPFRKGIPFGKMTIKADLGT